MNLPTLQAPYSTINNLLYLSYLPKVINAAVEAQFFEILSEKPRSFDDIAQKSGTKKPVTKAILSVLEKIGLISTTDDTCSLTPLGSDYLVAGSEANQLAAIGKFSGSSGPFDNLAGALKGEASRFDEKMWSSKEACMNMEQGMKAGGLQNVLAFIKTLPDFFRCTKMCDFAGNIGYYSYAFLQENPNLESHVYDLQAVCENARELKQNEPDFDRVTYHGIDIKKGDSFGDGYDFFYTSHFLYEYGANGSLVDFLKRVNAAMKPGGLLVSNHVCDKACDRESEIILALIELQTRVMGYPTHALPEQTLKQALTEAGFDNFTTQLPDENNAFPTLLLAARKS